MLWWPLSPSSETSLRPPYSIGSVSPHLSEEPAASDNPSFAGSQPGGKLPAPLWGRTSWCPKAWWTDPWSCWSDIVHHPGKGAGKTFQKETQQNQEGDVWRTEKERGKEFVRASPPPLTLLWMKVMPSRWPARWPTGCGLSSRSVRLSHTLHRASSLPEKSSCEELSANATAFTSSSWASIWSRGCKQNSFFTHMKPGRCLQKVSAGGHRMPDKSSK